MKIDENVKIFFDSCRYTKHVQEDFVYVFSCEIYKHILKGLEKEFVTLADLYRLSVMVYNKIDYISHIETNRFGHERGWVLTNNIIFYKNLKCEIHKK